MRGPTQSPGPLPGGRRALRRPNARQRFDAIVLRLVTELDTKWQHRLGVVEYAVEETPLLPTDWEGHDVPLSSLTRHSGTRADRIVLFRKPIEQRAETREELEAIVLTLLVEQLADLLGLDPEEVDPRYLAP